MVAFENDDPAVFNLAPAAGCPTTTNVDDGDNAGGGNGSVAEVLGGFGVVNAAGIPDEMDGGHVRDHRHGEDAATTEVGFVQLATDPSLAAAWYPARRTPHSRIDPERKRSL